MQRNLIIPVGCTARTPVRGLPGNQSVRQRRPAALPPLPRELQTVRGAGPELMRCLRQRLLLLQFTGDELHSVPEQILRQRCVSQVFTVLSCLSEVRRRPL